jgi:hypothetical protein
MCASRIQAQCDTYSEYSEHRSHTKFPYKTYYTKLLDILPEVWVYSQNYLSPRLGLAALASVALVLQKLRA